MKPSEATGPWDVGTTATSSVDITSHILIASVFDIQIHHNSSTLHTKDAITDIKISGFKPQQLRQELQLCTGNGCASNPPTLVRWNDRCRWVISGWLPTVGQISSFVSWVPSSAIVAVYIAILMFCWRQDSHGRGLKINSHTRVCRGPNNDKKLVPLCILFDTICAPHPTCLGYFQLAFDSLVC